MPSSIPTRFSIHGSTNLNFRSLENDKDFELVVCVEDEGVAQEVLEQVRDVDLTRSRRFTGRDVRGLRGRFRVRTRDPRTLLLLSRKVLREQRHPVVGHPWGMEASMSWTMPDEPFADRDSASPIETVILPRTRDLGDGFTVRRALPSMRRRMVGPFIFLDQMGPALFREGEGLDVRPHPHIGLATVTYLFDGEILHRDSLGTVQPIRPGAVNWMTAGRGIAHSERTPKAVRAAGGKLFGIQIWVALPKRDEQMDPAFTHTPADALPVIEDRAARVRLIAGGLYGARSPVPTRSELFYADAALRADARLEVLADHEERAVFVAEGAIAIGGETFGQLAVLRPRQPVIVEARGEARVLLLGGATMDGQRHIWWNLVSSRREQIEQAKADWAAGRFPKVPGETEFIPLPGQEPAIPKYP